jgi:hypothetical protein
LLEKVVSVAQVCCSFVRGDLGLAELLGKLFAVIKCDSIDAAENPEVEEKGNDG